MENKDKQLSSVYYVLGFKCAVHFLECTFEMCGTTWQCPWNVTHKLFVFSFFQHPFIADVVDNKPLKELYNEAKAVVIEEFEDLPEDKEVAFVLALMHC